MSHHYGDLQSISDWAADIIHLETTYTGRCALFTNKRTQFFLDQQLAQLSVEYRNRIGRLNAEQKSLLQRQEQIQNRLKEIESNRKRIRTTSDEKNNQMKPEVWYGQDVTNDLFSKQEPSRRSINFDDMIHVGKLAKYKRQSSAPVSSADGSNPRRSPSKRERFPSQR